VAEVSGPPSLQMTFGKWAIRIAFPWMAVGYKFKSKLQGPSSVIEADCRTADGAPAIRLVRVRSAIRDRPWTGRPRRRGGPQAGQTGAAPKPKFPLNPLWPKPKSALAEPPWPKPVAPIAETNSRTASESAFAPRMPRAPSSDVPRLRRPPNKFGIRDTPDPTPELEKPEPLNDEVPKLEAPKPEWPKLGPPKFAMERPVEKDENDENRGDGSRFAEK